MCSDEVVLLRAAMLALMTLIQRAIATEYYCTNQADDTDVDWFLIYKLQPTAGIDVAPSTAFAKGYGFFYLNPKSLAGWTKSTIGINENDQMLQRTLKPYYAAVANANKDVLRNTMRIWYSPNSIALPNCPKSPNQGVIMSKGDPAMWLTHSVTSFPPTDAYAWPDGSAKDNAQMLFCLSLDQNTLKSVVEALRYEAPVVYWQNLPAAYQISPYLELVTGQPSGLWASTKIVNFTTKGFASSDVLTMRYIAKTGKNIRLLDSLIPITQRTSLMAWTKYKLRNICSTNYKIYNIQNGMRIVEGSTMINIDRETDDSRWAVGENAALPIWCFTLSDRTYADLRTTLFSVMWIAHVASMSTDYLCREQESNKGVQWFLIYKMAKQPVDFDASGIFANGHGFFYLNSATAAMGWTKSKLGIDKPKQMLERTLRPYYERPEDRDSLRLMYTTKVSVRNSYGVLMSNPENAFWLLHDADAFPPKRTYAWPNGEARDKAQLLFCVSFDPSSLQQIARTLRYERPWVYLHYLPVAFQTSPYIELVDQEELRTQMPIRVQPLTTKRLTNGKPVEVIYITKRSHAALDLFVDVIAPFTGTTYDSWTKAKRNVNCSDRAYAVRNIISGLHLTHGGDMTMLHRDTDDSRWLLSTNKDRPIWCYTNSDRTEREKYLDSSAVCIENGPLHKAFLATEVTAQVDAC
ncbi:deoxyribonuclease II [Trichuris suis]|nr:deoxyribonuclease II [Trichuris suis]